MDTPRSPEPATREQSAAKARPYTGTIVALSFHPSPKRGLLVGEVELELVDPTNPAATVRRTFTAYNEEALALQERFRDGMRATLVAKEVPREYRDQAGVLHRRLELRLVRAPLSKADG